MPIPSIADLIALLPLLGLGLALYVSALVIGTAWSLTHPPRHTAGRAIARGRPTHPGEMDTPRAFEEVTFRLGGHDCPGWTIPGQNPGGPVAILTPGWGDSRLGALDRIEALEASCRRLVLWDSPGMGEASGWCGLGAREAQHIIEIAREVAPGEPLLLVGWSMGAGSSIQAAAQAEALDVVGVIAEAPYRLPETPAKRVLRARSLPIAINLGPALALIGFLNGAGPLWRGFDRTGHAARLRCSLLVLHGGEDGISPIEDGRTIADAAPTASMCAINDAGHNNLWEPPHRDASVEAVRSFAASLIGDGSGGA